MMLHEQGFLLLQCDNPTCQAAVKSKAPSTTPIGAIYLACVGIPLLASLRSDK